MVPFAYAGLHHTTNMNQKIKLTIGILGILVLIGLLDATHYFLAKNNPAPPQKTESIVNEQKTPTSQLPVLDAEAKTAFAVVESWNHLQKFYRSPTGDFWFEVGSRPQVIELGTQSLFMLWHVDSEKQNTELIENKTLNSCDGAEWRGDAEGIHLAVTHSPCEAFVDIKYALFSHGGEEKFSMTWHSSDSGFQFQKYGAPPMSVDLVFGNSNCQQETDTEKLSWPDQWPTTTVAGIRVTDLFNKTEIFAPLSTPAQIVCRAGYGDVMTDPTPDSPKYENGKVLFNTPEDSSGYRYLIEIDPLLSDVNGVIISDLRLVPHD